MMKGMAGAALAAVTALSAAGATTVRIDGRALGPANGRVLGMNHIAYENGEDVMDLKTKRLLPAVTEIMREACITTLRYPGGCGGTHLFDWKHKAGFGPWYRGLGVFEFMRLCEDTGAEPFMGLSAFRGSPEEAVEFLEFLNSPDDGRHKWAAERTKRGGHPKPYGVKYFEYGNESWDGCCLAIKNKPKPITPEEYGRNYRAFRAAMKAFDPNIELGIVMKGSADSYWDAGVLAEAGEVDFYIIHAYFDLDEYGTYDYIRNFGTRAAIAKRIRGFCTSLPPGRRETAKVAITEFNVTDKRARSLTAALANVETLFGLSETPELLASHLWLFNGGGHGFTAGGKGHPLVKRPTALAFELFGRHALDERLACAVEGRNTPVDPGRVTLTEEEKAKDYFGRRGWVWNSPTKAVTFENGKDGVLRVDFSPETPVGFWHIAAYPGGLPVGNGWRYRLEAEVRTEGMKESSGVYITIGDRRGWNATQSQAHTAGALSKTGEWVKVSAVYRPLKDTTAFDMRLCRSGKSAGTAWVRNVTIHREELDAPTDRVVDVYATRAKDGCSLACVLVNRSLDAEPTTLRLPRAGRSVSAEALTGPGPYATNEEKADNVRLVPLTCTLDGDAVTVVLPPHSAVGVKVVL